MKSPLRILHLEDDPRDAELVRETLETGGIVCHVARVETQPDFIGSLEEGGFDLILADHTLPAFDGLVCIEDRPGKVAARAIHLCCWNFGRRCGD